MDSDKTVNDLTQKISEAESATEAGELQLVADTKTTEPEISLEKTNNLGIKERVGYGNSEYDHSIPNRIHNVAITTDRVSNIILAPDEEFSFNKTLGEVSSRTGYRTAYVIKNGRTELGDGGGVCQVSTTLFRSVLNAGLEVTRRLPHSYRVSYYELDTKPGIDATVYSGDVDFRFKNDTGHHLLIHGQADSENLTMYYEIYGTSDGRTAQIVDHKVWDARPAPAPQYFDDPELPVGTTKQIDFATGGIKASFKNIIKDKNGDLIREEEYFSNYRPWSAKYLVGTKQP
jgi:vancomycin resistance protein YoaR